MKDKNFAGILALILGGIGIHHLYLGNFGRFIIYLLFVWTFIPMVLAFFEAIILFFSKKIDFDAKYNAEFLRNLEYMNNRK